MNNSERYQRVQELFIRLADADLLAGRIYLTSFYEKYTTGDSVYLSLFDALSEGLSYDEVKVKCFDTNSEDAVRKNLERFEGKLNEILTLPINIQRAKSPLDRVDRDFVKCLNLIQAYKVRSQLGDTSGSVRTIRQALKLAKRLELYDFALYCVNQLAALSKYRMMQLKSFNPSRERADLEVQRLNYSDSSYLRMASFKFYLIDSPNSKQLKELESYLNKIQRIKNNPFSASTERNILYTKLLYYDKIGDYKECLSLCNSLKDIIQNNYAIRKTRELQTIEINLALFYVLGKEFSKSNEIINQLLNSNGLSDINRGFLSIVQCRNYTYTGKIKKAIDRLLELRNEDWLSPVYNTQIGAILAYCYTLNGEYKQALFELSNLGDLKKDKAGWNLYSRILLILNYKLSDNNDSMLNEIENFRRYLHGKEISPRIRRHTKMALSGFELFLQQKDDLDQWNPTSSEVGDFDELLKKHSNGLH